MKRTAFSAAGHRRGALALAMTIFVAAVLSGCGSSSEGAAGSTARRTTAAQAHVAKELATITQLCEQNGASSFVPGSEGSDTASGLDESPAVCGCWAKWTVVNLRPRQIATLFSSNGSVLGALGLSTTSGGLNSSIQTMGQITEAIDGCIAQPASYATATTTTTTQSQTTPVRLQYQHGDCDVVNVPGGIAMTITDRTVSCQTALAVVRAVIRQYGTGFTAPGAQSPPSGYTDNWWCDPTSGAFGCTQTNATGRLTELFNVTISYPTPAGQQATAAEEAAFVKAWDQFALAHQQEGSIGDDTLCTVQNNAIQFQFGIGPKFSCSVFVNLVDTAFNTNKFTEISSSSDNYPIVGCGDMGAGRLTNFASINVNGAGGSEANDICADLKETRLWQGQAG